MYHTVRQERQIHNAVTTFFRTNMSPFAIADVALRQFVEVYKRTDIETADVVMVAGISCGDICKIGAYWMHPSLLNMMAAAYTINVINLLCRQIGVHEGTDLHHQIVSDFTAPDYVLSVQHAIVRLAHMNNLNPNFNQAVADLVYQNAVTMLLA